MIIGLIGVGVVGGKCFPENMQAMLNFLDSDAVFNNEATFFDSILDLNSVYRSRGIAKNLDAGI